MKVKKIESTIHPSDFQIRDRKGNLIEIAFFDDIEEIQKEDNISYLYYEYVLEVIYRDNLEDIIRNNYYCWFKLAKDTFIANKSKEIRAIRNKLLAESDKELLIDRIGLELPINLNATTLLTSIKDLFDNLTNILSGDWAVYRQKLRDITKQDNFPYEVDFPIKPKTKGDD